MIRFGEKVLTCTQGLDKVAFITNQVIYDATLRNLELLGEAATHIQADIRSTNPDIPWRMVNATRNRIIHGFLGIGNDTLWSIILEDVPEIVPALRQVREQLHEHI